VTPIRLEHNISKTAGDAILKKTRKSRRPYNLYCVGGDVKTYSFNQSLGCYLAAIEAAQSAIQATAWLLVMYSNTWCVTSDCRMSTTPGNPENLLEFVWSSWKFCIKCR